MVEAAPNELPTTLPIFPLAGVLLLPRGELPLHIFEPRYRNMTRDAVRGDRMIGMVQPSEPLTDSLRPAVYATGCAGRITSLRETEDGRYFLVLTGVCRFRIVEELPPARGGYRLVFADYAEFRDDLDKDRETRVDRVRLLPALRAYMDRRGIAADWRAIEGTTDERLVAALAMTCPFAPKEKQALLESADLSARSEMLVALLEMAVLGDGEATGVRH